MSKATHFEILAMGQGTWQVQAVVERQDAAVEQANDMHRLNPDNVFKVVRVDLNNGTGEFREREITKVGKPSPGGGRYADGVDGGPLCQTVEDMLSAPARHATRRILRNWLDSTGITALELLHHPDHLTRLENSGTMMQSAVQRAAMAQSKAGGVSLHDRQRVLFRLIDELLARARKLWRDESRPRFDGTNLSAVVKQIGNDPDADYLFNAALSDWMIGFKKPLEKFEALIALTEKATAPAELAKLDGCLGDFMADANAVALLLGEKSSLAEALAAIAELVVDNAGGPTDGAEDFAVFKQLVREGKLPQCRKALVRRITASIEGQRPLSDGSVAEEARVNAELFRNLIRPDGRYIGGEEMEQALQRRSDRFVNPDAIGRLLDGKLRPDERLEALLKAEAGVIGAANKRRFGEYIVAILRMNDNVELLKKPTGPAAVHMRMLATLQRNILDTGITDKQKQEAAEILDQICEEVSSNERIFEKIGERSGGAASEGVAVLRLCAAGTFTEGAVASRARERILQGLKAPDFLEKYLQGADDAGERRQRLEELQQMFDQAKVPETPLTAAVSMAVS